MITGTNVFKKIGDFSFKITIGGNTKDSGGGVYYSSGTATVTYNSTTNSFQYSGVNVTNNATNTSGGGSCSISNFSY